MNRRSFLLAATTPIFFPNPAHAYSFVAFTPEVWNELRQTDRTVILNFRASWSFTSNQKLEIIAKLVGENPAYNNLTFVDINWDHYGQSVLASRMKVRRHSTLIATKSGVEITRVVNEPLEHKMRAFLDAALAA